MAFMQISRTVFSICPLVVFLCCFWISFAEIKECYECRNFDRGTYYPHCPLNGSVDVEKTAVANCTKECFTRTDRSNKSLVYRGCTDSQYGLPDLMPPDGCYTHKEELWCICRTDECNGVALGKSKNVELNAYQLEEEHKVKQCYVCQNFNKDRYHPHCPLNGSVNAQTTLKVNCTKGCFTRTDVLNKSLIYRGCINSQRGLPDPLPPDGCYTYKEAVWCICRTNKCNGVAVGKPMNVELDAHLPKVKQCYVCRNFDKGTYYPHCPLNGSVNTQTTWRVNCTKECFTRTDDLNKNLIYRGCVDSQRTLPDPLPPDGCYKYYENVWCICRTDKCNGVALGKAKNVQLDAHLKDKGKGTPTSTAVTPNKITVAILAFCFVKYFSMF